MYKRQVNNNVLVFNKINDIDNASNVQIVENNYTYEELLTRLGILQTESSNTENNESQTNIIKEDSTTSNTEENQENEVEQEKSTETNVNEEQQPQNGYIKPEVTIEDFVAEVYLSLIHILPILCMHSPYEVASKYDVYSAYQAYKAFWNA